MNVPSKITCRTARHGSVGRGFLLVAALGSALLLRAEPINGTWIWSPAGNGTASWSDSTKWAGGAVAGGAGATADLSTVDIAGTVTVNINQSDVTLGALLIGDTNDTNALNLSVADGRALIFDNNGNGALLHNVEKASNTSILGTVLLADDVEIRNDKLTNKFFEIRGEWRSQTTGLKVISFTGNSIGRMTVNASANGTISDGAGQVAVVQANPNGQLQLNGLNSYSGGTTITNGGTVVINDDSGLGATSGVLTFDSGTLNYAPPAAGAVLSRDVVLLSGGGRISLSGNAVNVTGNISGAGGLTKSGSPALTLSGINTYEGGTTVTQGNVLITKDENLGAPGGIVTLSGGNLQFGESFTTTRDLVTTSTSSGGFSTNAAAKDVVWAGNISGPGRINKSGSGEIYLQGNNTYEGGTFITNGVLHAPSDANLGAPEGPVSINNATLDMRGSSTSVRNVTLTGNATLAVSFSASTVTWNGNFSGTGTLIKNFSGHLVLNGVGTYTGGTTVNLGTVSINGDFTAATGTYTVKGGRLNVNSHIGGSVQVDGGALSGHGRVGGSVSVAEAGRLAFTLSADPTAHVPLVIDQALNFAEGATLELSGADVAGDNTWTLLTAASFSGPLPQLSLPAGWSGSLEIVGNELRFALAPLATVFELWRELHFGSPEITPESAADADPDGDGLKNLMEYALGLDPLSVDGANVITQGVADDRLTLTFPRLADPDLTYRVEASDDLSTWTTIWTSSGAQNEEGSVTVTDTESLSTHPKRFLRLQIETSAW